MTIWRRLRLAIALLIGVIAAATGGYVLLGFGWLDALYQSVTTITTVGFREVEPLSEVGQVFTMVVILAGVGTALYTFSLVLDVLIEGQLRDVFGRRRMDRRIADMSNHVIICGWGRVGKAVARFVAGGGRDIIVVDVDEERMADVDMPHLVGDATDDETLRRAGVERARALVAAISSDADNLYVTLSARTMNPKLFIVSRARIAASEEKLRRAGADRVVNPQAIGGARIAAFVMQPHVAEFLDVVMHDGSLEFRLEEVHVPPDSSLAGRTLRDAHVRDRTGALVLAVRDRSGVFAANPDPETPIKGGDVLIAVGTETQLRALTDLAAAAPSPGL